MKSRHPAVRSDADQQWPGAAADEVVPLGADRPARRRRSALLGGGLLVAASPVAVGAGLFVPGFAALGLGALLLLLPPRAPGGRRRRSPLRVVGGWAAAAGRGTVALARGAARVSARTFGAVERFVAGEGRAGAVRFGRATAAGAAAVVRAASAAGSRGWSALVIGAPRVWRALLSGARWLAQETRSLSIRVWAHLGPMLRPAWAAYLAASAWVADELAALASAASERLSALVDSHSGLRQLRSLSLRALRPPDWRSVARRAPAVQLGSRVRSLRSRRSPPPSR